MFLKFKEAVQDAKENFFAYKALKKPTRKESAQEIQQSNQQFPSPFTPREQQYLLYKLQSKPLLQIAEKLHDKDALQQIDADFNIYFKEKYNSIGKGLYDLSLYSNGKIDITSQQTKDFINSNVNIIDSKSDPLLLLCCIGFHHKKGPQIEFMEPEIESLKLDKKNQEELEQSLLNHAMPDAVHNAKEDFMYFLVNLKIEDGSGLHKNTKLYYGVSCFKQVAITDEMREINPELTRNHLQKSLVTLSRLPLFGSLRLKLNAAMEAYIAQQNLFDFKFIRDIYSSLNSQLKQNQADIPYNELFLGLSPRLLIQTFGDKIMQIWKALFLEKRILVYSIHSSSCSNFILSFLSLFPGLLHFKCASSKINQAEVNLVQNLGILGYHQDFLVIV